ncbi:hypothetical protein [Microbacterium radiodurans]|uniref:Uncharacterized protein n=1 Tax=Microbacterium radiodurans TaxID=661398 RepID=A0A5J5IRL2_9MICO|nr:hypothetical protein [Microbacterium radiodurans]KAA9086691.1 hypothetical protein F6B42_06705 [Microbacterium radiodurans]
MQIILALIFGAAIGLAAEFAVPGRESRGTALAPALGTVVAAATWLIATWAGLTVAGPLIWIVTVAVPVVVVAPVLMVLRRVRAAHDASERRRLRIS